jgi:hypothetical protein
MSCVSWADGHRPCRRRYASARNASPRTGGSKDRLRFGLERRPGQGARSHTALGDVQPDLASKLRHADPDVASAPTGHDKALQVRGAVTADDPLRVKARRARLEGEQDDVQAVLVSVRASGRRASQGRHPAELAAKFTVAAGMYTLAMAVEPIDMVPVEGITPIVLGVAQLLALMSRGTAGAFA